ncbi:MAG: 3-dehydroquinate synthase [Gammaproteobacteria bacterium]|nr:3-dehydroquinate synthase [Gammaproteobacteria bacterium]
MKTLNLELGDRSYPIYIGKGLLGNSKLLSPHLTGKQVLIVSNETVAPLYLDKTLSGLSSYETDTVILPDGEQYKTLETLNKIFDALLQRNFDRKCTLISLGGGVIGDITGFAAASYQRGVNFIQIPTTLLSQVDSSVGGKTGVNHALGKNMIGAFHQPKAVLADLDTLDTLPDRELSAGIAEVIKYGLLGDYEFFKWLELELENLLTRQHTALSYAIERSCTDKARIVEEDELESGKRTLLNLGHTFGHAIENAMGYGEWLHGEAVAAGMVMAADMSRRLGWLEFDDVTRIANLIHRARLPVHAPHAISNSQFLSLMARDKKVINKQIRLVLLKAIGDAVISAEYDESILTKTIERHRDDVVLGG